MNVQRACSAALITFAAVAKHAFAQGCAACYTTAAAGGPQTSHALRTGILVLLIPPVLALAALMLVLRRWGVSDARGNSDPATR